MALEIIGFAISIASAVELSVKCGSALVRVCSAFKHANEELHERVLAIESIWYRTQTQLRHLERIESKLEERYKELQYGALTILDGKLMTAVSKINRLEKPNSKTGIHRITYARTKSALDETIIELKEWQSQFDPSWYLSLNIPGISIENGSAKDQMQEPLLNDAKNIRDALQEAPTSLKGLFLENYGVPDSQVQSVPLSSSKWFRETGAGRCFIVNTIYCQSNPNPHAMERAIRSLAGRLRCVDTSRFALLQCKGVIRHFVDKVPTSYDIVLRSPKESSSDPRGLRAYLTSGASCSLSTRLFIAQQLAKSVCYVHNLGLVHKSIRPEAIIGFADTPAALDSIFLTGFDRFRDVDGHSGFNQDNDWEKNLYRHPSRQGILPEAYFEMRHDIYSLGVCLLEIGLWSSLIVPEPDSDQYLLGAPLAPCADLISLQQNLQQPRQMLKDRLVSLARAELPFHMGDKYRDVVVNCLTCLDNDNLDFNDSNDFADEHGVFIGVQYIEKILNKLAEVSL